MTNFKLYLDVTESFDVRHIGGVVVWVEPGMGEWRMGMKLYTTVALSQSYYVLFYSLLHVHVHVKEKLKI